MKKGFIDDFVSGNEHPAEVKEPTAEEKIQLLIEDTVLHLEKQHGVKVHPILFYDLANDPDKKDPVIGYVKEPSLQVKIRVLDKGSQLGEFAASFEMLELCMDKEASDRRMYEPKPGNDKYILGACLQAQRLIEISLSQFKKK